MAGTRRLTNLTTGGPVHVDVEDGQIVRIIPLQLDENDGPTFTIHARGRDFTPPRRTTLSPWTVAHKSTIYAPNRILTPLKRVDFDPNGERNTDKRGESGYEPISWDEALDMVADEMIRLKREVGPAAMLTTPGSHHMWGNVGYRFSAYNRFMNLIGYTYAEHNPDSWEGWQWGGAHMWGFSNRLGIPEQYDLLEDALKHSEMVVFWSADPETTGGVYGSFESTVRRDWLKQTGMKMVFIDPYYNHTAGLIGDKWFAPRLGTDVAMGLAIAFVWLTEGLYDKEYVATRTHGFDEWKAYVLGESDGTPKTPEWAEIETTIPAREIRALAREWGTKKTMLAAGGMGGWGGACRAATGNEWTRTMIALAAMQGLGKPGSNIWSTTSGAPFDRSFWFPGYAEGGISGDIAGTAAGIRLAHRMWPDGGTFSNPHHSPEGQIVSRLRIPEAMRHESMEWRAKGFCGGSIESQFTKYRYPASGYPHVQMYYRYGGSFIGTMTDTNRYVQAYRDGKVGFVVNQSIWFEGEARFADIILPACTNFERWDIGDWAYASGYGANKFDQCNHRTIVFQQKCIEPLGESKPDYEIFAALADRLGVGDIYTEGGHTDLDWVKRMFHASDLSRRISWEEFEEKGYYVVPVPEENAVHAGAALVRRGPGQGHSRRLARLGHGQEERAPDVLAARSSSSPAASPASTRPTRSTRSARPWARSTSRVGRATAPPSCTRSSRCRWCRRTPASASTPWATRKGSWSNDIKDHRVLKEDGHYYWIMRLNTKDAAARGIKDGDLIRAYNDRAEVILVAQVTERVPPGTVHSYESCADYLPVGEPGYSADKAGCVNMLTSHRFITPTSTGQAPNSCLIEVEKI